VGCVNINGANQAKDVVPQLGETCCNKGTQETGGARHQDGSFVKILDAMHLEAFLVLTVWFQLVSTLALQPQNV
jgi:hypothetical protein